MNCTFLYCRMEFYSYYFWIKKVYGKYCNVSYTQAHCISSLVCQIIYGNAWHLIIVYCDCSFLLLSGCAVACVWLSLRFAELIMTCALHPLLNQKHTALPNKLFGCLGQLKLCCHESIDNNNYRGKLELQSWTPISVEFSRLKGSQCSTQGNMVTLG